MKRLFCGLAASLLMTTSASAATFGFRGADLGMSLEAFKAYLYPDDPASGFKPDCTDGPYAKLSDWREDAVGVVSCGFQGKIDPRNMMGPGLDLKLGIEDYSAPYGLYAYYFAPAEDGVKRLANIWLTTRLAAFEAVIAHMTALYGNPTVVEFPQDWPAGSPYRSRYTWSSGDFRIVVRADPQRNQGPDAYPGSGMSISYTDVPLYEATRKKVAQASRLP